MVSPTQEQIEQTAYDIGAYLQDAAGDFSDNPIEFHDEAIQRKARKAIRHGVTDIRGWLADEIYNDADFLHDLAGDKIHDACTSFGVGYGKLFNKTFIKIAYALSQGAHEPLRKACFKLIDERNKHYTNIKDDPRSVMNQALW